MYPTIKSRLPMMKSNLALNYPEMNLDIQNHFEKCHEKYLLLFMKYKDNEA